MEGWSKSIFETLELVADVVDEFFLGFTEMVEDFADEVENTVGVEVDQYLQDIFESIADIYYEIDDLAGETDESFTYPIEPTLEKNSACIGCRHYHGQVYSGHLFVCAMHPYGWDSNNCPDWESN
ncbi:hypothetical protein [Lyngbya aestuarii]|uniref:hypothetical protein n=1 Tax=Lyngbya aestuarii TaxID=118322 RepID=UPI00403D7621